MSAVSTGRSFVGHRTEFELNKFKLIDVEGDEVGVVRTRRGFFGIRNYCPHGGAEICRGTITGTNLPSRPGAFHYGAHDALVRCPWHGWEFHLDNGQAAFGLSKMRLITYSVEVEEDGNVYVTRSKSSRTIKEVDS